MLYNPKPEKSICTVSGLLADAVEFISGSVTDSVTDHDVDYCDLYVAADPDEAILEEAYSALKPGGNLYVEWTVNPFIKPVVINERLSKAGFERVILYLPKPDPSKSIPAIWIPLGVPGAIEFLTKVSTQNPANSVFKHLSVSIRRFLWISWPDLFLSYPWLLSSGLNKFSMCSVSRKSGSRLSAKKAVEVPNKVLNDSIISRDELLDLLMRSWDDWKGRGDERLDGLSTVILTSGTGGRSKVLLIVFAGLNSNPSLIVKFARTEESASLLKTESDALRTINEKHKNIRGIPKILFSSHDAGIHMNVQTVINGAPLASILNKNNFRELALIAASWLAELARSTRIELPEHWRFEMVDSVLSVLNSSIGSISDPRFLNRTTNILGGLEIPCLVYEHRDFGPQNIFLDSQKRLGVIDWENCRLSGIPALDLIFFLMRACRILDRVPESLTYGDFYRRILDPETYIGRIFEDCLNYYMSALNIQQSQIPRLRLMTWVVHYSLRVFRDRVCIIEPDGLDAVINHWAYKLWMEELSVSGDE